MPAEAAPADGPAHGARGSGLPLSANRLRIAAIMCATLVSAAMGWSLAVHVWSTGYFGDTDDALRLAQVRDLMAGQGWYDLRVHRLDPPDSLPMHWSRIVDLPLVLLIKFFAAFLSMDKAELAARHAFPLLLSAALFYAIARAARNLTGDKGVIPALALCLLTGVGFGQFQPGRIDHHAPQIVLLVLMLSFMLDSLTPQRASRAAVAGSLAALSLGISVENLPFIMAMSALPPAFWILEGEDARRRLFAYGAGLALSLPLVVAATIPPSRWTAPACDALSIAYALPGFAGALGCMALGSIRTPAGKAYRLTLAAAAGGASIALLAILFPHCLRGPLGDVDPLLRRYWLDNVHEARPLLSSLTAATQYTILVTIPPIVCAALAVFPLSASGWLEKRRWIVFAAFAGAGIAATFWQIRASSSLAPVSILAGAWLILKFRSWLEARRIDTAAILSLALAAPLTSLGWATAHAALTAPIAAIANAGASAPQTKTAPVNCFASTNYAAIAALKPGLIAAPIDVGAHMLAHTHHSVLAGAYHRNNAGNRKALDILFASPAAAEALARAAGADYVAVCMGSAELGLMRKFAPGGLAIRLSERIPPAWLQEVTVAHANLRLFRVLPKP